jgi:DNA-binding beta-propeller fold protein YncE
VHAAFLSVPGGPESLVVDAARRRAYTNLWKAKTLAIDVKSRKILERWDNGCADSRGIALDRQNNFVFAACAEGKAVVLDAAHGGKILGSATSGSGVDIIDYDPKLGHLYFPGAQSQTLAIFSVSREGRLSLLGTTPTAASAHCVVSDQHGNAYVCEPKRGRLLVIRDSHAPSAP